MFNCVEQESLALRRSIYGIGNLLPISEICLLETISECLKNCPSAFNMQSSRLALLLNKYHQDFWNLVWKNLKTVAATDNLESAKNKITSFSNGVGTILFFEDSGELRKTKKKYPLYKSGVRDWAMQGNAMLQYMIWNALAENNIGSSLQHYNKLIEKELKVWLKLPKNWQLIAQMPFGNIEKEAGEKDFLPVETRLKIFK